MITIECPSRIKMNADFESRFVVLVDVWYVNSCQIIALNVICLKLKYVIS